MRVVRYVGPGEDERHLLVESVEGDEKFSLYITDELRQAASIDLPRLNQQTIENKLTPREIQVRVRSGESPREIAEQSGMPLDRVLRFASAVVQERLRITGEARNGRARRNSPDGEFVVFGEHVDSRFTAHGIEPGAVSWDAYRNEEGSWVLSAGWHGGDLKRVARWTFALSSRTVSPIDDTAADLLSDRPIRPVVHVVYDIPIANPADSVTGPIPSAGRDELFDQHARFGSVASPAPSSSGTASVSGGSGTLGILSGDAHERDAGEEDDRSGEHASVLPLRGLPEPSLVPGFDESDDEHAARARIPSWDDILLGVRRKRD
jgi:hypothetical protein